MRVLALAGEERMKSAVADLGTEVPLCDFVAMQRSCKSNLALVWLKLEQWAELRQAPAGPSSDPLRVERSMLRWKVLHRLHGVLAGPAPENITNTHEGFKAFETPTKGLQTMLHTTKQGQTTRKKAGGHSGSDRNAEQVCDDLLNDDATDAKARLRRGQALMELGECPQSEEGWGAAADIGRDG